MSRDEARQHIRAAQEAELAGNKEGAVLHLQRAALIFVRAGQHAQAARMYRNCIRLAPDRTDLQEALRKAEEWAKPSASPEPTAAPSEELTGAGRPVITGDGFDALAIPRGPTRVPEGTEAWCSFCCRPTAEIGELVAGPAGAFICTACITASLALLGMGEVDLPVGAPAPPVNHAPPRLHLAAPPVEPPAWLGPELVWRAARASLLGVGPPLLVLGPEGCSKTALLEALSREHLEAERVDLATDAPIPATGPLLVEHLDLASKSQRAALAKRALVATWRTEVEGEPLQVKAGETVHALPHAPGFAVPPELGALLPLALTPLDAEALQTLLARALDAAPLDLEPALAQALVARAQKSGRGAKGLLAELAVLRALPPGAPLTLAGPPKRSRKKKP